jgi:hypothetical protein
MRRHRPAIVDLIEKFGLLRATEMLLHWSWRSRAVQRGAREQASKPPTGKENIPRPAVCRREAGAAIDLMLESFAVPFF